MDDWADDDEESGAQQGLLASEQAISSREAQEVRAGGHSVKPLVVIAALCAGRVLQVCALSHKRFAIAGGRRRRLCSWDCCAHKGHRDIKHRVCLTICQLMCGCHLRTPPGC